MTRIAVLMTCFNRREKTLACLQSLFGSTGIEQVQLDVFLVDDASRDGTPEAVRKLFPSVQVFSADGSLFWCRGMHRACAEATAGNRKYDHLLWLNDDTELLPDALERLLKCSAALADSRRIPVIVVGSTVDPVTGSLTYGGEIRVSRLRPLRFKRAVSVDKPVHCDSMNGNVVLVSQAAFDKIGNLDPAFEHAMGDTDYALRARKTGVEVWAAPGHHGTCSHNPVAGTFFDASARLGVRWKNAMGRKGLPWRSWLVMTRRHGGTLWPLLFAWPYLKVLTGRYGR